MKMTPHPLSNHCLRLPATLFVFVLLAGIASGTQPIRFNYQAKLTGSSGAPLQGVHTLFLALWDGGTSGTAGSGTELFAETAAVTTSDGIVNHTVGTGSNTFGGALNDTMFGSNNDIYLEVAVDGPLNVILPRTRLESVPFAAQSANGVPAGSLILNTSPIAPPGYSATGNTLFTNWIPRAPMITPRYGLSVTSYNGRIYATGGIDANGVISGANEQYDPVTDSWTTRALMLTPRLDTSLNEINGLIYSSGGLTTTSPADMASTLNEAYDPVGDTWSVRQPLTTGRAAHASAVANGKIYVFGGVTSGLADQALGSVEEYNSVSNTWLPKAPMPTARVDMGAANINGIIYVAGGISTTPTLVSALVNEAYDPLADSWTSRAPVPVPVQINAAVAAGGKLYLIGGTHGLVSALATVWIYDPVTDAWSIGVPMSNVRIFFGAAVANGKIYAVGGVNSFEGNEIISQTEELSPGTFFLYSKN